MPHGKTLTHKGRKGKGAIPCDHCEMKYNLFIKMIFIYGKNEKKFKEGRIFLISTTTHAAHHFMQSLDKGNFSGLMAVCFLFQT